MYCSTCSLSVLLQTEFVFKMSKINELWQRIGNTDGQLFDVNVAEDNLQF